MSSNITVRTLMVVLRSGRTMPLYSAPESISHRLFCQGEYFPPLEFMQTPPFRVEFGCHISTIVPPQWEPIRPMGTIVCASKEVSKEVSKETQKRTESHLVVLLSDIRQVLGQVPARGRKLIDAVEQPVVVGLRVSGAAVAEVLAAVVAEPLAARLVGVCPDVREQPGAAGVAAPCAAWRRRAADVEVGAVVAAVGLVVVRHRKHANVLVFSLQHRFVGEVPGRVHVHRQPHIGLAGAAEKEGGSVRCSAAASRAATERRRTRKRRRRR